MRKIHLLIAAMLFSANCAMQAQTENDIIVTDQRGQEEIIMLPEGMTVNIDSMMNEYNAKTYLQPDTNCKYKDINPMFSREVYIDRLKRLPNIMEMPYNDEVQTCIDRYAGRFRRNVSYMLGACNLYMPIFEQALEEYGLPLELKYLPVIESSLNPKAVSRVGATGLWQFMITTAKQYGLEVNSLVDERCDPIKASYAAAHYLKDLYRIYGDWNLVIAAYNCGPDNISKAIHRADGETDYWKIYPYLPKETRGYVPAFIAANYIMNYYCEHNICAMETRLPTKTDTIMVNRNIHFEQISAICGVDIDLLRTLNPQYRRNIVNGYTRPSILRLPQEAINVFIDNEDSIYAYQADVLLSNRTVVEIPEDVPEVVRPVHPVVKKGKAGSRDRKSKKNRRESSRGGKSVTVKSGQTLSEIARRNHTTVDKLKRLNGIKGSNIRAGKKLKIK